MLEDAARARCSVSTLQTQNKHTACPPCLGVAGLLGLLAHGVVTFLQVSQWRLGRPARLASGPRPQQTNTDPQQVSEMPGIPAPEVRTRD